MRCSRVSTLTRIDWVGDLVAFGGFRRLRRPCRQAWRLFCVLHLGLLLLVLGFGLLGLDRGGERALGLHLGLFGDGLGRNRRRGLDGHDFGLGSRGRARSELVERDFARTQGGRSRGLIDQRAPGSAFGAAGRRCRCRCFNRSSGPSAAIAAMPRSTISSSWADQIVVGAFGLGLGSLPGRPEISLMRSRLDRISVDGFGP